MKCSERDEGNWVSKNILSFFALPCLLFVCPSSVEPKSLPLPKCACHCHINWCQIMIMINLFGSCLMPLDHEAPYGCWWIPLIMIDPGRSWWNLTKPNSVFNLDKFHPDMEKVSRSLAVLADKSRKRIKFGISPRLKFENANLLGEDFPLFPCLHIPFNTWIKELESNTQKCLF